MLKSPGMKSPARMQMYKNAGKSPANFRESLRVKCLDRLRNDRFARQNAHRNLSLEVAVTIKQTLAREMEGTSFDDQMAMFEELQAEIQKEFEQEEAFLAQEQEYLAGDMEPDVFCPKCKRHPMDVDHTGCLCKMCRFGYKFPDGSSLSKEALADRIQAGFNKHSETGCDLLPDPATSHEGMFLLCSHCQFTQQIL